MIYISDIHVYQANPTLQADYATVVEDRPIMSAKCYLAVPVFHF